MICNNNSHIKKGSGVPTAFFMGIGKNVWNKGTEPKTPIHQCFKLARRRIKARPRGEVRL